MSDPDVDGATVYAARLDAPPIFARILAFQVPRRRLPAVDRRFRDDGQRADLEVATRFLDPLAKGDIAALTPHDRVFGHTTTCCRVGDATTGCKGLEKRAFELGGPKGRTASRTRSGAILSPITRHVLRFHR